MHKKIFSKVANSFHGLGSKWTRIGKIIFRETKGYFNYVEGVLAEGRRRQPPTRLRRRPEDGVGEEEGEGPPRHLPFRYRYLSFSQCSGSMTFWCGSGSGSTDPGF
jgi:hypothetical protein